MGFLLFSLRKHSSMHTDKNLNLCKWQCINESWTFDTTVGLFPVLWESFINPIPIHFFIVLILFLKRSWYLKFYLFWIFCKNTIDFGRARKKVNFCNKRNNQQTQLVLLRLLLISISHWMYWRVDGIDHQVLALLWNVQELSMIGWEKWQNKSWFFNFFFEVLFEKVFHLHK